MGGARWFDAGALRHQEWVKPRLGKPDEQATALIDGLELPAGLGLTGEVAKLHALAQATGEKEVAAALVNGWRKRTQKLAAVEVAEEQKPSLEGLPEGTWLLEVRFTLESDLLCKDDAAMYAIDNPVKKDRVSGYPEYWGPSWKGILRHAFLARFGEETEKGYRLRDVELKKVDARLFGNTKREKKRFRAGRLRFFTTRFGKTGFAILHPMGRKPKKGNPILYETVPKGAEGVFRLLYCPFDGALAENLEAEVRADAEAVGKAIGRMFALGLGAKSSSGFGEARIESVSVEVKVDPVSVMGGLAGLGEGMREWVTVS